MKSEWLLKWAHVKAGWYEFTGLHGKVMGIDRFGASGKGSKVIEKYGFTPEHVAEEFMKM